jgi:hypothetical protein
MSVVGRLVIGRLHRLVAGRSVSDVGNVTGQDVAVDADAQRYARTSCQEQGGRAEQSTQEQRPGTVARNKRLGEQWLR